MIHNKERPCILQKMINDQDVEHRVDRVSMYGHSIEDFDREELLATVYMLMDQQKETRERHTKDFDTLHEINQAGRRIGARS